jgi:asparagine synthase (glutamine-hydrolysing)
MCGIAGIYELGALMGGAPAMLDAIAHRGPDAAGEYRHPSPQVWLGHRRLSIIDLSEAANQPFVSNGLAIVFNGEIYNYRELRHRLEGEGIRFRTSSDTEVLLEAWRRWGAQSLRMLRGMFAFAIFEERTGRLVMARDPFGIKPLFIHRNGSGLAFASEAKALVAATGQGLGVDPTGLVASLMYYWLPEEHSAYQGLEKLPPGHWAEISPGAGLAVHRFWDPIEMLDPAADLSADDLADVIEDSVRAHLVADVPVGAFLSGGLDSSIITALAARHDAALNCYTIKFRSEDASFEAMPDDAHYARIVARQLGLPLHEIEIAPNIVDLLPRMVRTLDEPIGDAAAINTVLICEGARQAGIKVLLSGMGADELFGGYRKHQAALLAARYRRLPVSLRNGLIEPMVDRVPVAGKRRGFRYARWAKRFVGFASLPESEAFQRSYALFGRPEFAELLDPDLMPVVDRLLDEHAAIYERPESLDPVNRMCLTDVQMFLVGLNLAYTDRASMAASTEVRVPYVDLEVGRAAFAIPGDRKIVGRRRKAVLRDAARRWLPDEIIERPKGLFSAPLRAWIRRELKPMIDDLVLDGTLVRSGFLQRPALERLVAEDRAGVADRSKELWQLLTMEVWLDEVGSGLGTQLGTEMTAGRR